MKSKVLIIEDEPDLSRLFRLALERGGHSVRLAFNGLSGLEECKRWGPDLILLDVSLPGISGFALLPLLRRNGRTCVILMSGKGAPEDIALGRRLGAEDYLVKPFSLEELQARVKLALRRPPVKPGERAAPGSRRSSPARRRAGRSSPR